MTTVSELIGGDVVEALGLNGMRTATFIGRSDHPKYPGLALVIWRLDDGSVSLDALDYRQDVGTVVSKRYPEWHARLHAALSPSPDVTPNPKEKPE